MRVGSSARAAGAGTALGTRDADGLGRRRIGQRRPLRSIAATEQGRDVLVVEMARRDLAGGNPKRTAGAMRFVHEAELRAFLRLGGEIRHDYAAVDLIAEDGRVAGLRTWSGAGEAGELRPGPPSSPAADSRRTPSSGPATSAPPGPRPRSAGRRTTPATGSGWPSGSAPFRTGSTRAATPRHAHGPAHAGVRQPRTAAHRAQAPPQDPPLLGRHSNTQGERLVDEGEDFRNYTYARFGRAVLGQPDHLAWQILDAKVDHLLYGEYKFHDARFVQADTLDSWSPSSRAARTRRGSAPPSTPSTRPCRTGLRSSTSRPSRPIR